MLCSLVQRGVVQCNVMPHGMVVLLLRLLLLLLLPLLLLLLLVPTTATATAAGQLLMQPAQPPWPRQQLRQGILPFSLPLSLPSGRLCCKSDFCFGISQALVSSLWAPPQNYHS